MESSIADLSMADQVLVELYGAVAASRREESYLSLESIGAVIAEALDRPERRLLAHIISSYDQEPTASEIGAQGAPAPRSYGQ